MKLRAALFIAAGLVSGPAPVLSPPSVAPGSPLPQGYFDVLFYSNKADLTPQGQEIIDGVSHAQAHQVDQFDVIDDANFSLISDYDRALSDRRAKAVVAPLVADGVPKSMIKIYYEDIVHSAWSAAQDPHEPQNRDVVVFLPCSPPPPG